MQRPRFAGPSGSTGPAGRADHAIVIGGSMAGLLAARVLADHVDRVTVIERDRFPAAASPRAGVPQGWHTHVMLLHGKQVLERLFPGLDAELAAAGAPSMDLIGEFLVLGIGGWTCRFPSPFVLRPCSRPLLEVSVRRRLAERSTIQVLEDTQVVGLVADAARSRVTGVRVQARGAGGRPDHELAAALVVDASGRASRTPAWLGELGYTPPRETVINAFLGYASRVYEPPTRPTGSSGPSGRRAPWKGLLVTAKAPDCRRGGVIWPLEHGRFSGGTGACDGHALADGDRRGLSVAEHGRRASHAPDAPVTPVHGSDPVLEHAEYHRGGHVQPGRALARAPGYPLHTGPGRSGTRAHPANVRRDKDERRERMSNGVGASTMPRASQEVRR